MNEILGAVLKCNPKKDSDLKNLESFFNKNEEKFADKNQNQLNQVLVNLQKNFHGYTLGVLNVLYLKTICQQRLNVNQFFTFVSLFIKTMDLHQLRFGASKFEKVITAVCDALRERKSYIYGIHFCREGIQRFQDNTLLTPFHHHLISFFLQMKNYKMGYQLVEQKILTIKPDENGLTPTNMIAYYYYSGLIYIGMKQYKKALKAFEVGLTVPTMAFHAIQIEIFKKFVLLELLTYGKFRSIPSNASQIIKRHMKNYCNFYMDFAKAFASNNYELMQKIYRENEKKEFTTDKNLGLVKQCMDDFHKRKIKNLTQTYIKISLKEIAKAIGSDSESLVQKYLLQMIEKGEIDALINQKDGMVEFVEKDKNNTLNTNDLSRKINQTMYLATHVKNLDNSMKTSTEYIAKINGVRGQEYGQSFRQGPYGGVLGMVKGGLDRIGGFF